jgi:hypothetical protein
MVLMSRTVIYFRTCNVEYIPFEQFEAFELHMEKAPNFQCLALQELISQYA